MMHFGAQAQRFFKNKLPQGISGSLWFRQLAIFLSRSNRSAYPLAIARTDVKGFGVVANCAIPKDALIIRMEGRRATLERCLKEIRQGIIKADDPLQISEDGYIILNSFCNCFNHSCDPNAGIRNQHDLVAIRDIPKGAEITFDYSTTVPPSVPPSGWQMQCACETTLCRRLIGNVSTIPPEQLSHYRSVDALPELIQRSLPRTSS